MTRREEFLQQELAGFVSSHSEDVDLGGVDEIVLSYMVSILDELGSGDATEDLFDVEEFTEMMDAYLPGFGNLDCVKVSEWMFDLAGKLNKLDKQDASMPSTLSLQEAVPRTPSQSNGVLPSETPCFTESSNPFKDILTRPLSFPNGDLQSTSNGDVIPKMRTLSLDSGSCPQGQRSRTVSSSSAHSGDRRRNLSCSSTASNDTTSGCTNGDMAFELDMADLDSEDPAVGLLQEMFPAACTMEINHCLSVTNGNTEDAAQLILMRQECGQSITESASKRKAKKPGSKKSSMSFLDDQKMKETIIKRYSYVDIDSDKKEHKPIAPLKQQEKKMIRYLDSKIVSTRGERFTEIKKDDDEKMKKTYVNLKPAKQYRFH